MPTTNEKKLKAYLVMINEEYCDGQAIITHPNGEFGGEHYVELSNTYPICIGTYRSESRAEAIRQAAKDFECHETILTAQRLPKSAL